MHTSRMEALRAAFVLVQLGSYRWIQVVGCWVWTAFMLGRQGAACTAGPQCGVPGAGEDLRAHMSLKTSPRVRDSSRPLGPKQVGLERAVVHEAGPWRQLIANAAQVGPAHAAAPHWPGWRGCTDRPPRWLSSSDRPEEAIPAALPPDGRATALGMSPLDQLGGSSRETRERPPTRACRPRAAFRWRGEGTAAPWRGL